VGTYGLNHFCSNSPSSPCRSYGESMEIIDCGLLLPTAPSWKDGLQLSKRSCRSEDWTTRRVSLIGWRDVCPLADIRGLSPAFLNGLRCSQSQTPPGSTETEGVIVITSNKFHSGIDAGQKRSLIHYSGSVQRSNYHPKGARWSYASNLSVHLALHHSTLCSAEYQPNPSRTTEESGLVNMPRHKQRLLDRTRKDRAKSHHVTSHLDFVPTKRRFHFLSGQEGEFSHRSAEHTRSAQVSTQKTLEALVFPPP
jgi:hypothetical protein